jgi:hypothetical protein
VNWIKLLILLVWMPSCYIHRTCSSIHSWVSSSSGLLWISIARIEAYRSKSRARSSGACWRQRARKRREWRLGWSKWGMRRLGPWSSQTIHEARYVCMYDLQYLSMSFLSGWDWQDGCDHML